MAEHIVKAFDQDIAAIRTMLAEMGGIAEEQLSNSVKALVKRDLVMAEQVVRNDDRIDQLEREIEEKVFILIAKRQPMARDLRGMIVAVRIAADIERIGDLAKNTAKRANAISEPLPRRLSTGLNRMGAIAQSQLNKILTAFAREDDNMGMEVWRSDEELDALYNSIFRELLTYMMEDPRNISLCTHLLFGAKNIERIGDHTTNIAENIHFLVHGSTLAEGRPKKDNTATFNPHEG